MNPPQQSLKHCAVRMLSPLAVLVVAGSCTKNVDSGQFECYGIFTADVQILSTDSIVFSGLLKAFEKHESQPVATITFDVLEVVFGDIESNVSVDWGGAVEDPPKQYNAGYPLLVAVTKSSAGIVRDVDLRAPYRLVQDPCSTPFLFRDEPTIRSKVRSYLKGLSS